MPDIGNWTGVGQAPTVASVSNLTPRTIRVQFSEPMSLNDALLDAANYVLTPGGGGDVVRSVARLVAQGVATPQWVDLILDGELTAGSGNYTLTITDAVLSDAAGNLLAGTLMPLDGAGAGPAIEGISMEGFDLGVLTVKFTKAVKQVSPSNGDDALNSANYKVSGPSSVSIQSVSSVDTSTVALSISGLVPAGQYRLTVSNVEDTSNNEVQ